MVHDPHSARETIQTVKQPSGETENGGPPAKMSRSGAMTARANMAWTPTAPAAAATTAPYELRARGVI
jgi:hypothetical protein